LGGCSNRGRGRVGSSCTLDRLGPLSSTKRIKRWKTNEHIVKTSPVFLAKLLSRRGRTNVVVVEIIVLPQIAQRRVPGRDLDAWLGEGERRVQLILRDKTVDGRGGVGGKRSGGGRREG
jgi:hypothetical protein